MEKSPGSFCTCLQMAAPPTPGKQEQGACWAPSGCSVAINPSILQTPLHTPPCEIGSLPEATQLVSNVRIQTQAPASRHLNQEHD